MRGRDDGDDGLFSYVRLEERIPPDHPLRAIRKLADEALAGLNGRFEAMYSDMGRPSIAPEMLLRATLMNLARVKQLLSSEHFSVDGTLIEAWASMKSFAAKDGSGEPPGPGRNGERNFRKEKRSNETHASKTDPDARLYRKADGRESKLCFMGHVLMENRNGLAVGATLTQATGTAEREAALAMLKRRQAKGRITLGADKAYDVTPFIAELRTRKVTPHISVNGTVSKLGKARKTAMDQRTLRHAGYTISQRCRKRIEEIFGWVKKPGGFAKTMLRGRPKVEAAFTFTVIAYNLIRIPKLIAAKTA